MALHSPTRGLGAPKFWRNGGRSCSPVAFLSPVKTQKGLEVFQFSLSVP